MKEVDPVEELHEIRQRICKKAGGTPADYFRYYLEMDREKVAALKTGGAAKPVKANPVQSKRSRKQAKPSAKASARKEVACCIMEEVDPIEEIHEIRRKLMEKAGGTPEAFVRYLMERQKQYADRLVNLGKPKSVQSKRSRKQAKPAAKASTRKGIVC